MQNPNEKPVIIIGANGLGRLALDIFNANEVVVYCFLDEDETKFNTEMNDVIVMGSPEDEGFLKYIGHKCEAFVAEEEIDARKKMVETLAERRKVLPVNAVHRESSISSFAFMGYGNFVGARAVIQTNAKIPNHCLIQAGAILANDVELGDFVNIGAGTIINQGVKIGEGANIGAGCTISSGVKIGKKATVVSGSVVLREVGEGETVFGVPAVKV